MTFRFSPPLLHLANQDTERFGPLKPGVLNCWKRLVTRSAGARPSPYYQANRWLARLVKQARWGRLNLSDASNIPDYCDRQANLMNKMLACHWVPPSHFNWAVAARIADVHESDIRGALGDPGHWFRIQRMLAAHGITEVTNRKWSDDIEEDLRNLGGVIKRLKDPAWWERKARKAHAQFVDDCARVCGLVNGSKQIYCADDSVNYWQSRQRENWQTLEETEIENDLGQVFTLAELSLKSTSNPSIRRMELMTRLKGFEYLAEALGYKGTFITLTCPSRFHAFNYRKTKGGKSFAFENKKWDGSTVRDAQIYLRNLWARIRAELSRCDIDYFGFRVAEPHHDGCPHWHLLLFAADLPTTPTDQPTESGQDSSGALPVDPIGNPRTALGMVEYVVRDYGLRADPTEPGAVKRRVKIERIREGINPDTGRPFSATGYIAKYISKNIDGYGIADDLYGQEAKRSSDRIRAWASTHSIRQFQQIGGIPVTHWRELRRIAAVFTCTGEDGNRHLDHQLWLKWCEEKPHLREFGIALRLLESDTDAAQAWCKLNLWIRQGRIELETLYQAVSEKALNTWTGELIDQPKPGKYGEHSITVKGLVVDGWKDVFSRLRSWRVLRRNRKSHQPTPIDYDGPPLVPA